MALKQDGLYFVLCPKKGNKIEGDVLSRVCILGFFCPKQETLSGPPIPKYWSSTHPPLLGLSIQYMSGMIKSCRLLYCTTESSHSSYIQY